MIEDLWPNHHSFNEIATLIEENKNSEDNYEKQVDKSSKYAVKLENIDFSFANSNENFYENLNLVFEKKISSPKSPKKILNCA